MKDRKKTKKRWKDEFEKTKKSFCISCSLTSKLDSCVKSSSVMSATSTSGNFLTRSMNPFQIPFLVLMSSLSYLSPMWIRDWKASSKVATRFVVRKSIPWKYSNIRRKMLTSALRLTSRSSRCSKKTSASSINNTARHVWAISSIWERFFSRWSILVPSSPTDTI